MENIEELYKNLNASLRDGSHSKDEVIGWGDGDQYFVHSIEDALNYIDKMRPMGKLSTSSKLIKIGRRQRPNK